MTLPETFSLASKNFINIDTMSFATNAIINTNSSLTQHEQQPLQHQPVQNPQGQIISPLNPLHSTMSTNSTISNATHLNTNTSMFDADANSNANMAISPPQLISANQETEFLVEFVMPSIYLTKDFISWKQEQLHAHGFTHIIIIDKHIQELYYPNQQPDIFKLCLMNNEKTKNLRHDSGSSMNAFDDYCPPLNTTNHLSFGKEFQVIDLNFGEKSYLTTVLPNCYRAVKFINKALQAGGKILVIDCNGGEQKCLTIIVAFLMYNYNTSFSDAFARLKSFYKKADLDRFYISQLYEYEPILQVQRAQSRGHSCSRDLHAAILKRKKTDEDYNATLDNNFICSTASPSSSSVYTNTCSFTTTTTTTELLNNCNPLNRFDSIKMKRQEIKPQNHHNHTMTQDNHDNICTFTGFVSGSASSTATSDWGNWDDCAME